ncbi:MAG: dihydroorotase [Schleiferiaceae bacterium]
MKYLIKSATILDPKSPFANQEADVLIADDQIVEVSENIVDPSAQEIQAKGLFLSPGWVDSNVQIGEPGFEERETLESGTLAAARGGFTSILLSPDNTPSTDNKGAIEYLYSKTEASPVHVYPMGTVTAGNKGVDLAELFDMYQSGAIAFSDGKHEIKNPNLLKLALQYSSTFGAPIFSMPYNEDLGFGGKMNEGKVSTMMGLKGIVAMAEDIAIQRDLAILEYAGGHLHINGVSTAKSVQRIQEAKNNGLNVTASVNLYNLLYTEENVKGYNTSFKTLPPLRPQSDQKALIEALKVGVIDVIATDHTPCDIEIKQCEFDHAAFGMALMETAFGGCSALIDELGMELWIEKIATRPREIFDLPSISISEGNIAELTLFDPKAQWSLSKTDAYSKAVNNPMFDQDLTGKVVGIFNKGQFVG